MELILRKPDGSNERLAAESARVEIGRARECQVAVADPMLSRRHAVLYEDGEGRWWVEDLGSRNGTWLNGSRVEGAQRLGNGDLIEVGGSRLTVVGLTLAGQERPLIQTVPPDRGTVFVSRAPEDSLGGHGQLLAEAARALVSPETTNVKLETLLQLAMRTTSAERGLIASLCEDNQLRPLVAAASFDASDPPRISSAVRRQVLDSGEAVIAADVADEEALKSSQTLLDAGVRSVLCAPLVGENARTLGVLYLDTIAHRAPFEEQHLEVASVLGGLAGITLEAESVRAELEVKRRMEADLSAAWDIQQSLLPSPDPDTPSGIEACGHHIPCQAVGGDLFDLFRLESGEYGAMVADVAGKGLTAALLGAEMHGRWKGLTATPGDPNDWLARLNEPLHAQLPTNRFVTLAFALVDLEAHTLRLAAAGQTSIYVREDEVEVVQPTGLVLGMMPEEKYELIERPFPPGSRLLLFSDGVTDQIGPDGEPFEMDRLLETIRGARRGRAQDLRQAVLDALQQHAQGVEQSDDTTLVVVSCDE
jgi:serine phosphatase RsbU (regulator of sigma subunit)/pSer/pThr/pTyr-binding forkhead associated (FHA) protein